MSQSFGKEEFGFITHDKSLNFSKEILPEEIKESLNTSLPN